MRRASFAFLALFACAHETPPADVPHPTVDTTPVAAPPEPAPQYVVSDQGHEVISLGKDGLGTIVDGVRVIVLGTRVKPAKDIADPGLVGAYEMPSWMGGGFLFRSSTALYTAETFDGPLKPLVSFPSDIDDVGFAPKYLLVRASSGQRWPIDPKTGQRVVPAPIGVVDVAALGDGRAAALTEFGGVWVTSDGGNKWTDVAAQLQGPTDGLRLVGEELWIVSQSGPSARVDPGGRLAFIDHVPEKKPISLRPRDPRWKSSDFPIRRALLAGVPDGERQAVVVEGGSVARVDVLTGELLAFSQGKLPPEASCEPVRTADDVVFACVTRAGGAFVASHVLSDKAPTIEQSFPQTGVFFAGDDGGLAFDGSCSGQKTGAVACVRTGSGIWQELELDPSQHDSGAGPIVVTRWIPRADGGLFALVLTGSMPAIWDARTGAMRPLTGDAITPGGAPSYGSRHHHGKRPAYGGQRVVDRSFSFVASGSIRGWSDNGLMSIEIRTDGSVSASPFHFDLAQTAGPNALARTQGRLWQSSDRGATWVEVDPPPLGTSKEVDIRSCSLLGCDLGHWYRIGWAPTPPQARADVQVAPGAARIDEPPLPTLSCKPSGPPKLDAATRSGDSPEDLGLGNAKVATGTDSGDTQYARFAYARATINPPHGEDGTSGRDEPSARMLVFGYLTDSGSGSHFTVLGPVKDPLLLRRSLAFVAPFDPSAIVRRTSYGISDLVAAARTVGMTSSDVLTEDPSIPAFAIPALQVDPTQASDLAFTSDLGMVGVVRANGRVKLTMRPSPQETLSLVSAASIAADDLALLEVDSNGLGHVSRWTGNTITALYDVSAPPSPDLYPANPDAVAVNAAGDIAIIRTPSGGEPPTASQPALLYQPGRPVQPLAAWSTLTLADDPACKNDPGFRAVINAVRPWFRLPRELTETGARMIARVKWSQARVCLEAVEIRTPDVTVNVLVRGDDPSGRTHAQAITPESWMIARFAGGVSATRAAIGPGVEWREPYACTLTP